VADAGGSQAHPRGRSARVTVLAPTPLLTVTVESGSDRDEVHLHPGGQGVWIARLVSQLDVEVVLCATFGGESGLVAEGLLERLWGLELRAVSSGGANAVYVHDRRSGERVPVAETPAPRRTRHEVDELYGTTFVAALETDVLVLGGPERATMERGTASESIPFELYRRLPSDLASTGVTVIADLCGEALDEAASGGVDILKVSDEELLLDGRVSSRDLGELRSAMSLLREKGVGSVVVTRAEHPTIALLGERFVEVVTPTVHPVDDRGAGDSVTAGVAAAVARGATAEDALRLGAAAGALNVARRGFGSGSRREIEALSRHIVVRELA
jgi:1-phosphofructokinase